MHIVEILADGTEEQLEQCMELDTHAVEEDAAVAAASTSASDGAPSGDPPKAQPLVKLLDCKPVSQVPMPPGNLMLWVDGALAPALNGGGGIFIDLAASANPLTQPAGPSPCTGGAAGSSNGCGNAARPSADTDDAEMGAGMPAATSSPISPAVSAIAAAAVRSAAEDLKRARSGTLPDASPGWPHTHARFAAVHSPIGEEGDVIGEGNVASCMGNAASSMGDGDEGMRPRASSARPEHVTTRSSSVELCPPPAMAGGSGKSPCVKCGRHTF